MIKHYYFTKEVFDDLEGHGFIYYQVQKFVFDMFMRKEITETAFKIYVLLFDRAKVSSKNNYCNEDGAFANDIALINGKPYREVNPTDNKFVRVFDDRGYSTDYYNNWATYKIAKDIIDINMYTGIKDCNDVEIYEGDIVKDVDYGVMKCKYLHGSFVWYSENGFNIKLMSYIPNVTIIGNIYENPELLLEK